jgi:hypothetical protein
MLTNALLNDGLSNPVQVIRGLLRRLRLLAMTWLVALYNIRRSTQ